MVNRTITFEIRGGLGNQLFQFAAGFAIARKAELSFELDTTWYTAQPTGEEIGKRKFKLHKIFTDGLDYKVRSHKHSGSQNNLGSARQASLTSKFRKQRFLHQAVRTEHRQKPGEYQPNLLRSIRPGITFRGYWQSPKYFESEARYIKDRIKAIPPSSPEEAELLDEILTVRPIALQVRRGDYLNEKVRKTHGMLPLEYFLESSRRLASKSSAKEVWIFSDDPRFCSDYLHTTFKQRIIPSTISDVFQLRLLTECSGLSISNSTFGWWGAWASNSPVIYPYPWALDKRLSFVDIGVPEWETLTGPTVQLA